jgi:anion-transporting  ArsA/GET3 family ATPase
MTDKSSTEPRLAIFCGKGGVGKTSMALAFALERAERGHSVLVVTSHPLKELAISVSLAGLKQTRPDAAANLFIIHIDPLDLLANRVRQAIPSKTIVEKVLNSPIYNGLIEIAPGLKEMAFLSRLHEMTEQRTTGGEQGKQFESLVWDAPATGHFLQTLKVSQQFETYLSGPFALLGREVSEFFSTAANLRVIPVTALEEMAVEETVEMCDKLAADLNIHPSRVICNMCSPLVESTDSEIETLLSQVSSNSGVAEELKFVFERQEIERSLYKKLRSSVAAEPFIVKRTPAWNTDLDLLTDLAKQLSGLN